MAHESIECREDHRAGAARLMVRNRAAAAHSRLLNMMREQDGQGTTEYAILVGVLVVIAIVAVVAFRGRVQELWSSIADAINGL